MRRRLLTYVLLIMALGGVGVVLSSPWWLAPVLRPWARARGLVFGSYMRLGYARFQLRNVRFARPEAHVTITAAQIDADTPLLWLWHLAAGSPSVVDVRGWTVRVQRTPGPASDEKKRRIDGIPDLYAELNRVAAGLQRWLPQAELRDGAVHWPGADLTLDHVDWRKGVLRGQGMQIAGLRFQATVVPGAAWTILAQSSDPEAALHARLTWQSAQVEGGASLWSQPLRLQARFPASGWLPADGTAEANGWNFPAERVKLGDQYDRIQGSGRLIWREGKFIVRAEAKATPKTGVTAPPLEMHAEAQGDRHALTIAALRVQAPFATANLSSPVTLAFTGQHRLAPARLTLRADLAKQPWIAARGQVQGSLIVAPSPTGARQEFQLEGDDLHVRNFSVQHGEITGALEWPRLELTTLRLQLDPMDHVSAHGTYDLQARELADVTVQAQLTPAWFARWLPRGAAWKSAELTAHFSGPLRAPEHTGTLRLAQARLAPLKPFDLSANWRGEGLALANVSVHAVAGTSAMEAAGAVDARGARVEKLRFASGDQSWTLLAPATVAWSPVWHVAGLQLRGPDGGDVFGEVEGGANGRIKLAASKIDPAWWQDWISLHGPRWRLDRLQADGRLVKGRLVFSTRLAAQILVEPHAAEVRLAAEGDDDGVRLTECRVTEGSRVLTNATGRMPVTWNARAAPHLDFAWDRPIKLEADTDPDSPLWPALAEAFGITLSQPSARLQIGGTLRAPQGVLDVSVARLGRSGRKGKMPLPDLQDFRLRLRANRGELILDSLAAEIEGQALRAAGRLPMNDTRWQELWHRPAALDWSEAEASVEIPGADLSALARRLPAFPLAQGRLHARVQLAPDKKLTGELQLAHAVSRPLEPLGLLQDINADLLLTGRTLEVRSLTAALGGEPVALLGRVVLPEHGAPRFALDLRGKNLPLVRSAGLLVRSDLDLRAETDAKGNTRVTGTVALRDSLVLADLTALLPTGTREVTQRPPYFSIPAPPFDRWQLAVAVRGRQCVRIRTTVFSGTASVRLQLAGTLGEPRAVGEVSIDEGQVLFPFATFNVQLGVLRLPESDPFHPQLTMDAISNRQDYQLRLEARGPPESPTITFSSNPPLEASQVLLLVTTGQAPPNATTPSSDQQRLARLGTYLGKGLVGGLGGDGGRLTIVPGNQTSEQGHDTYEVDYKLNRRWWLVGEYDEFDSYNIGVKWRIYEEGETRHEKK